LCFVRGGKGCVHASMPLLVGRDICACSVNTTVRIRGSRLDFTCSVDEWPMA